MSQNRDVYARVFPGNGNDSEFSFIIEADAGSSFEAQVAQIVVRYHNILEEHGLDEGSAVFRRLFLSDILNQMRSPALAPLMSDGLGEPVAVSVIQQAPLSGAKVCLFAYHIGGTATKKTRIEKNHLLVTRDTGRHLWSVGMSAPADRGMNVSSRGQTELIFNTLTRRLDNFGGNLADHCQRTWLYAKDVDVFYDGLVEGRKYFFASAGLTADTHYIASTGIEGGGCHPYGVITMDAYSNLDIRPEQIVYLNDFERLCRTDLYKVTFERGTRISYADRHHYFISGTASIDGEGMVVHIGDPLRQCERSLENVDALLAAGGASLRDLQHAIVYLRDPADYPLIRECLESALGDVPYVVVKGAVCRPTWLVEIEGIAATINENPNLPRF